MSGLDVAYWQKVFNEKLPIKERILHKKFDQLDKYYAIPLENLSDWHHKQMKDLEEETQEMIAFLEINRETQKSYLIETAEVADSIIKQWIENQQLRQEIEQKDTIIENLLNKFKQTINNNLPT